MKKFKCLQSGSIVEVDQKVDIDSFRKHFAYVEVDDDGEEIPSYEELIALYNANKKKFKKKDV